MIIFNDHRIQLSNKYTQKQQQQYGINFHIKPFAIVICSNLNILLWMIFLAIISTTNGATCSYKVFKNLFGILIIINIIVCLIVILNFFFLFFQIFIENLDKRKKEAVT